MSTDVISDNQAFWRLKAVGFDSYQATRTIGFCATWQRLGGSVEVLLQKKVFSRATVYNRLRECHRAGFEPDLVKMAPEDIDAWESMERTMAEDIKRQMAEAPPLPRWIRWAVQVEAYPHLEEESP